MINKNISGSWVEGLGGCGKGKAFMSKLFDGDALPKKAPLMAVIDLEPGSDIGYHQHPENNELYWIIEGEGEYNDNGEVSVVTGGMATMCYVGGWHSLKNTGDKPLKLLAVIVEE